jgi:hypothetical protein
VQENKTLGAMPAEKLLPRVGVLEGVGPSEGTGHKHTTPECWKGLIHFKEMVTHIQSGGKSREFEMSTCASKNAEELI